MFLSVLLDPILRISDNLIIPVAAPATESQNYPGKGHHLRKWYYGSLRHNCAIRQSVLNKLDKTASELNRCFSRTDIIFGMLVHSL
jgi:hypothetical protein